MSKAKNTKQNLTLKESSELFSILEARFENNLNLHKDLKWVNVLAKLEKNNEKLWSLNEMERTGGEPDVVDYDTKTGEFIFYDCSTESTNGRRSLYKL